MAFMEERLQAPHQWLRGHDCVSFALGAVEAQTGIDLLADIPEWNDRASALRVARSLGGLPAALDERMDRVPLALAQRGDIAGLADRAFGVRLMVVEGATLAGPGDGGLQRLQRRAAAIAWSAGTARRVPCAATADELMELPGD